MSLTKFPILYPEIVIFVLVCIKFIKVHVSIFRKKGHHIVPFDFFCCFDRRKDCLDFSVEKALISHEGSLGSNLKCNICKSLDRKSILLKEETDFIEPQLL